MHQISMATITISSHLSFGVEHNLATLILTVGTGTTIFTIKQRCQGTHACGPFLVIGAKMFQTTVTAEQLSAYAHEPEPGN